MLIRGLAFARYGWRRRFERHGEGGVTVAGLHGSTVGIGEGARATSAALKKTGLSVYDWDLSAIFGHTRRICVGNPHPPEPGPGTIIVQMNALELVTLVARTGRAPFAGKRCIGYWAWELETIPASWRSAFRYVDEIWTPSNFTSEAIRRSAPKRIQVRTLPHPVKTPEGIDGRARFGLPPTGVAVLTAFDIRSGIARKNPLAAIAAFELATRNDPSGAFLVLKIGGIERNEALFADIQARVTNAPNIHIITESLDETDRDRLIMTADIVLSLHRSEGFGLLMAEAMLAGKAVVATDWSGNLDFMTADSARLIPVNLVPVVDPQKLFTHGRWADPDIKIAAKHLRELIDIKAERLQLGETAQLHAEKILNGEVIAQRIASWIRAG